MYRFSKRYTIGASPVQRLAGPLPIILLAPSYIGPAVLLPATNVLSPRCLSIDIEP